MEIYKQMKESEYYLISNYGNIISKARRVKNTDVSYRETKEHLVLQKTKKNGYKEVCLTMSTMNRKMFYVHRLVVSNFIGEIPTKHTVNHKNGERNDNRLENLEIMTYSENARHSFDVLKRKKTDVKGEKHPRASVTELQVSKIKKRLEILKQEKAIGFINILCKEFNIKKSTMGGIVSGKNWSYVK